MPSFVTQYRQLKKQIGRAEEELMQLEDEKQGEVVRKPQAARRQTTESTQEPMRDVEDYRAQEMDLERGEGAADSDDADDERIGSPVTISKSPDAYDSDNAPRSPSLRDQDDVPTSKRPSTSRRLSGLSASSREQSDETTKSAKALVAKPTLSRKSSKPRLRPNGDHFKPTINRIKSSDEKQTLRKWRFGLTPQDSIEEVIDRIPPQSRKFFKLVDKELEKVGAFWDDRMEQALKRYDELSQQWKELAGKWIPIIPPVTTLR